MILAAMTSVIAIGFVVYLALNPSVFVASVLIEQIGRTAIPDQQKGQVVGMIKDVERRYADGELTRQQVDDIGIAIGSDPAINAAMFFFVAQWVIERDEIPDEKPGDLAVLARLVHGVALGTIDGGVVNELAPRIATGGKAKRSGKIEPEDFAAMMDRARAEVAGAQVPDTPYTVDAAALFGAAIDRGLNGPVAD